MKYGIPLTLDTPYNQPGIKSHLWVTQNIWGDHTDPYGYLSQMGVSKEKLAYDLAHGFTDENIQPHASLRFRFLQTDQCGRNLFHLSV